VGSFLEEKPAAAMDLAYRGVERAFDRFLEDASRGRLFILAGRSQGSIHLIRWLRQRVIGTPMQGRHDWRRDGFRDPLTLCAI
jgi:hypothetical protein